MAKNKNKKYRKYDEEDDVLDYTKERKKNHRREFYADDYTETQPYRP